MPRIRTVNMVWEKRLRGAYPVSRYGLNEEGALSVVAPRPLEARAYDLTHLRLDGGVEVRSGFVAEKLLKLEATPQADHLLGMTADDLYLFRPGSKGRFLGERHLLFIDISLSADGQKLAAAFSDMAAASFAVALGEIDGHEHWTLDVDATISVVTLSPDGAYIAIGAENGTLWLVDAARREMWQFGQEEPVRALACARQGAFTVYGTANGSVGLIDLDGRRRWDTCLDGEIAALALSGEASLCAALVHAPGEAGGTRIFCLTGPGQAGWEYDAEKRLAGLALSPEGRYLAVSARDATTTLYEVVPGEGDQAAIPLPAIGTPDDARTQAAALAQEGDLEGACRILAAALDAAPADAALCEDLLARRDAWFSTRFAEATAQFEAGDYAGASGTLEAMQRVEPLRATAVALLEKARWEHGKQRLAAAEQAEAAGDVAAADAALREAIACAPFLVEARRALGTLRTRQAEILDAEAEERLARGEMEAGVAALEKAQAMAPSAARATRLERAQIAREFTAGLDCYNEKRYQEAVFQFKKVLARDPAHAEAQRYLGYAQKFVKDAAEDSQGDRFRYLE
ncbi:MAG TPA: hypothetical protein VFA07_12720 [Chthonomonadaceae bacterium]|nr:hypothetical protein [Chthonomonadaceae bacterium]